jgi:uncharacterized protein YjbI with pentapeptide repeats
VMSLIEPNDTEPTPERQAELREAYERNIAADRPPYAGVSIHTRGEVRWILHERHWSGEAQMSPEEQRPDLRQAVLSHANLSNMSFVETHFEDAKMVGADLRNGVMPTAHLEGATLTDAILDGADLTGAHLERTDAKNISLVNANLFFARFENAFLSNAHFGGANLRRAYFNEGSSLNDTILWDDRHVSPQLADVRWGNVNLATIDWSQVRLTGDEYDARSDIDREGKIKTREKRLANFQRAVRVNRQLAAALRNQGLHEDADRFAYRAQFLRRQVLRQQRNVAGYLGSISLDILAGYGYKPARSIIAYLTIILGFMIAYLLNAQFVTPHLSWDQALVLSVSSFHGRGFFATNVSLGDTYARLAAGEAILGLFVEISFIATFTQRFFAK